MLYCCYYLQVLKQKSRLSFSLENMRRKTNCKQEVILRSTVLVGWTNDPFSQGLFFTSQLQCQLPSALQVTLSSTSQISSAAALRGWRVVLASGTDGAADTAPLSARAPLRGLAKEQSWGEIWCSAFPGVREENQRRIMENAQREQV